MTVRVYRSTDTSAPVLTGSVGTLTALLDAILVNGYGSMTAAGWTINQTATNKRGYKQNLTGSNNSSGMLLYVDDTGPGAGGAREARACGFETMSAITPTGTGQFPTSAQTGIGTGQLVIRKSTSADATARAWTCVANGQTIYLFIENGDNSSPASASGFIFGDFKPYKPSDQYAVCIIGRQVENNGSAQYDMLQMCGIGNNGNYTLNNYFGGHYIARHWTGIGGSKAFGKVFDVGRIGNGGNTGPFGSDGQASVNTYNTCNTTFGRFPGTAPPYPNGPDNGMLLSPILLNHSFALRGYLPGLWAPLHDRPLTHNDTLTITSGTLNGKSLVVQAFQAYVNSNANGENGQVLVETSDTWS